MSDDDIQKLLDETRLVAVQEMFEAELFEFARAIEQRTLTNQKAKWYQEGVEAEREACAKLCESMRPSEQEYDQRFYTACTLCANAIRARGQ